VLGDRVQLISHAVIDGRTTIGEDSQIFPFACLGLAPQDKKYHGEASELCIGARAIIREHVTIHPGTEAGGMRTVVGDDNLIMATCHIAHDCRVGDRVVMANHATLAGHVVIGNDVTIGGLAAIQQYVRVGDHAMVGGMAPVDRDVLPYAVVIGERAHLAGINRVGLKRRGFSREAIVAIQEAVMAIGHAGYETSYPALMEELHARYALWDASIGVLTSFVLADPARPYCRPVPK
jgi:UDP-N-acetylglucosamine acyltransferase